ncbi:PBS lyase HEAT-like repeat protein [Salmonella enterica subsp. enterica serovar Infantis str. SARB27]|uniref:Lyase n=2 Tax=Salmonella infantis TaxID=595 RepID=A0A5Y7AJ56_SALIN|nr:HEAT repeat domain-containing protein [Salmonella enterica]ECK9502916.1 lyase [Salmonella enterica subsp. enterica serovar Infantis str. CFSAN000522]EHB42394.1 PBS lyase HEAT-like repeat protein [Salmonella enterica subsp. enterica serovar Infantis str. SARB27]QCV25265.1 lyase [Salmonella enterica subsp. enterica serovar Infantis]QCV29744.1 lyase [Salmonella enterica subsp. enterica serovar Infantis]HAE6950564.1 lyase [Salmonella enterica subsp. enterica serovar Infantis]
MKVIEKYKQKKERREIFLYEKYKNYTIEQLTPILYDNDLLKRNAAIFCLQILSGDDVFNLSMNLCHSRDNYKKKIGVTILSQMTMSYEKLRKSFCFLENIFQLNKSVLIRASIINALGHFCKKDKHFERKFINLCTKVIHDKSANVRCAIAAALSNINDNSTIPLLLCLLRDNNSDVKNWAAFSINFNQYDTEDIREEFVGMLLDTNDDIRIEVISGLAERKDERVLETIIKELKKDVIFDEIVIAAGNLGSKKLLPILNEILNEFRDEYIIDKINESIKKIKENVCE